MIARPENAFAKLMIAGEYAVLFGASAIVAGVNRKAQCSYFPQDEWEFIVDIGNKNTSSHDQHPLFMSVKKTLADHGLFLPQGKYVVDTSAFFDARGQKLGLGSSAAAIVALSKMAFSNDHHIDLKKLFSVCLKAHRDIFGYGSGADIAAAIYGGIFLFRSTDTSPFIRHLDLSSLWQHLVLVDTKKPQNTSDFVKAAMRYKEHNPAFVDEFCRKSDKACEQLCGDFDLASSINAFHTIFSLENELTKKAQIGIISDEHAHIFSLAKMSGGSAKPSGAGGGDIALAIVPEKNRDHFRQEIISAGFTLLDLAIAPPNFFHHDS